MNKTEQMSELQKKNIEAAMRLARWREAVSRTRGWASAMTSAD